MYLGCGTASYGNELLEKKALFYTGVEGSSNMVAYAKENLKDQNAEIIHSTLEDWDAPIMKYDLENLKVKW